jgi:hypothetical protein
MKQSFHFCLCLIVLGITTSCSNKSTPKPAPVVSIDINLLIGPVWNTTSVMATKPDGTTVTITTRYTDLFLAEPRFDTLPSGTTLGTGNEKLFGENFVYTYDSSGHVLTVPFNPQQIEIATITKLDAHTLVLHHDGNSLDYGSTYSKFDQTLTR